MCKEGCSFDFITNEEIYIFVQGSGEFQVGDRVFPIGKGTVVRIDPEEERCIWNTSDVKELCWIVAQSRASSYADHTTQDEFGVPKKVSWVGKQQL